MNSVNLLDESYQIIQSEFFNDSFVSAFIWENNKNSSIKTVSKNITALLGYDKSDFIIKKLNFLDLIHPDDILRVVSETKNNIEQKSDCFIHEPYRVQNKEKKYIWIKEKTTFIKENNKITHYISYLSDCSKKNYEKEISKLNERYELTLDAVDDGIWDWDIITDSLYLSKNWLSMLGYEERDNQKTSKWFISLIHPNDKGCFKKSLEEHYLDPKNNKYSLKIRLVCKDGTYKWIHTRGKAILDENGTPIRMLGYHTDITQEIEYQIKIKKQKKS